MKPFSKLKDFKYKGDNQIVDFFVSINNFKKFNIGLYHAENRVINKIGIYKTQHLNGIIETSFKKVNFSEFRKHFGINKTNRIVGTTPDYVGAVPSKILMKQNYFVDFVIKRFDTIKAVSTDDFYLQMMKSCTDTRVTFSKGYSSSHAHLKECFKDNASTLSTSDIIEILSRNKFSWFRSPVCSFYNPDELNFYVRVNNDAYTGHYTSRLYTKQKYFSTHVSRTVARKLYNILEKSPIKNWYLWSILGRSKDIKLRFDDVCSDVGSRVILSTEDPMSTLLMWFSQKIQNTYFKNNGSKFDLKGEFDQSKSDNLRRRMLNYDYVLEADWTFFDSNVDSNYIIVACNILLAGLPNDKLHNNIRYLITSSLLTKYVVVPPGVVVELNRSVPSGHPFTSTINCVINTIYWSQIGQQLYGDNYQCYMDIELYGDDAFVMFKDTVNLTKLDDIIASLNLKSETLSDKLVRVSDYYDDKVEFPDFLKRRITDTGFKWNYKKLFDKIFYQSKKRGIDDQISLLLSYVQTSSFDKNLYSFTKLFYQYLVEHTDTSIIDRDIFKTLEELCSTELSYNQMVDKYELKELPKRENTYSRKYQYIYMLQGSYIKYFITSPQVRSVTTNRIDYLLSIGLPISVISKSRFIYNTHYNYIDTYINEVTYYNEYNKFVSRYNKNINRLLIVNYYGKKTKKSFIERLKQFYFDKIVPIIWKITEYLSNKLVSFRSSVLRLFDA